MWGEIGVGERVAHMPRTREVWGVDKKNKGAEGCCCTTSQKLFQQHGGRVGEGGKNIHRETSSRIWRWQGIGIGVPSPRASPDATENEKKIL